MSLRRVSSVAVLLTAVLPLAAWAQTIHVAEATAVEGAGTQLQFRVFLSAPTNVAVTFDFHAMNGSAVAGEDFVETGVVQGVIPAGQTSVVMPVTLIDDGLAEGDEGMYGGIGNVTGAELSWIYAPGRGNIVDDEPPGPVYTHDDRGVVQMNSAEQALAVLGNDGVPGGATPVVSLVGTPGNGVATLQNNSIVYTPAGDFSGEDSVRYRLCAGSDCDESIVRIAVRPFVDEFPAMSNRPAGSYRRDVDWLPALPSARFVASALAAPETFVWQIGTDPTPATPFDAPAGTFWDLRTLPAGGPDKAWVLAEVLGGGMVYLGIDRDGNGQPSVDEVACATQGDYDQACELALETNGESVAYWVLAHNLASSSSSTSVTLYEIGDVADGTLFVSGPGHVEADEGFPLHFGVAGDTMVPGETRVGMVTVHADADTVIGHFPFRFRYEDFGPTRAPVVLVDRQEQAFALAPGETNRYTFIDVPPGATRLTVSARSDQNIDLYLVPFLVEMDPSETVIYGSPSLAGAVASATRAGGNETVEVSGAALTPGRWYVVPRNRAATDAQFTLKARIEGIAPIVRPGSYFNEARPGSGLFLYPAADQLTGLWYTYDREGLPAWYYLQGAAPKPNGVWSSPIFRAAWDGDSHHLVAIGHATVTPTADDRFSFSYRIDGEGGSQPMAALGRGCPASGAVDISSTWFDPARPGTGHSVQMFPDYEYFASFVYDDQGFARFVAGERASFGGDDATMVLQQLQNACPTCAVAPLLRTDVGVLQRQLAGNALTQIAIDLEFAGPLAGGWTATDLVMPLGGAGTTQGCD